MKTFLALLVLLGGFVASSLCFALEGTARNGWYGKPFPGQGSQKPTVYAFAQPNCALCALQLARIAALKRKNPTLEVVVVAQNAAPMTDFLSSFAMKTRVVADPQGVLVRALELREIPALVLVDAQNTVRGFYEGQLTLSEILSLGSSLARGRPTLALHPAGGVGELAPTIQGIAFAENPSSLIVFHSSTCPYCKKQLPDLLEYARKNLGVPIWIVVKDDLQGVKKQFSSAGANLQVVLEPTAFARFEVRGTPAQLRVNSGGRVTWRLDGFEAGIFKKVSSALPAGL